MAFLVFLARSARAGIVAPDLRRLAAERLDRGEVMVMMMVVIVVAMWSMHVTMPMVMVVIVVMIMIAVRTMHVGLDLRRLGCVGHVNFLETLV